MSSEKWSNKRLQRYENSIRCELTNKYSAELRRQMFPFSVAKKIVAIAFKNHRGKYSFPPKIEVMDTIRTSDTSYFIAPRLTYPPNCEDNDVLRKWRIMGLNNRFWAEYCATEIIELNQNQIDSLSQILFNYQLNKPEIREFHSRCIPIPKNAILFLGENDAVLAAIEICFACYDIQFSFDRPQPKLECHLALNLKDLLQKMGIKYGIE
jgi:hypothetical protein